MNNKNDGGPAFSRSAVPRLGGSVWCQERNQTFSDPQDGMSLRAYMATHVLQGFLANSLVVESMVKTHGGIEPVSKQLAQDSCVIADALIKELGK